MKYSTLVAILIAANVLLAACTVVIGGLNQDPCQNALDSYQAITDVVQRDHTSAELQAALDRRSAFTERCLR